jgi:hypothetical protein
MYGQSGYDQSLIKLVTVNDSRGKDVVLVFTTAENKNSSLLWSCYEIQD